jgi:polysaccharide export outer membrane protein
MMPRLAPLFALLLVTSLARGVTAAPLTGSPAPAAPATKASPAAPDNYVLAPGDQIEITIFGEPDLTRTVAIKPDGVIALPLVDQVKASGKTAAQLETELTRLYSKYLRKPSISIIVRQFRMDRVYVMGEVSRPGRYDLTDDMTVLDALTLAGGPTDKGNLDSLQVGRMENGKSKTIPIKGDKLIRGQDGGKNLRLQNGDLVFIPRRGLNFLDILQQIGFLRAILPW